MDLPAPFTCSYNEEIDSVRCSCSHCVGNTRPLQKEVAPRLARSNDRSLGKAEALLFALDKLLGYRAQHFGMPDVYVIPTNQLYTSAEGKFKVRSGVAPLEFLKHFEDDYRSKAAASESFRRTVSSKTSSAFDSP